MGGVGTVVLCSGSELETSATNEKNLLKNWYSFNWNIMF